ncbi:hypothetical protein KC571_01975 [candidate division WWE3 bacterium]|uniref:50S ribosomal protein L28 n=1 Tax=candidate division WWE3 bacterium TaxID=2053526 RepID=A0A955RP80_UNCKA|nr:hypothetical protein [candidate division WWE3 bacterium]
MSKVIKITSSKLKGNWVPRLIGRRVPKRTGRFQKPNMQKATIEGVTYIASAKDIKTVKKLLAEGKTPEQIEAQLT